MRFEVTTAKADKVSEDVVLVAVFEDGKPGVAAGLLEEAGLGIRAVLENGDIAGKTGELLLLTATEELPCRRVLLVGCGKQADFDRKALRSALQAACKWLAGKPYKSAASCLAQESIGDADAFRAARITAETWHHASYRFDQLKTDAAIGNGGKPVSLERFAIAVTDGRAARAARRGAAQGDALGQGVSFGRTLANLPANICTPNHLAKEARALAKKTRNLRCKVLGETEMRKLGMGALLSVTAGSAQPARLIVLEYTGAAESRKPAILVGKGITFDTGGISIKPAATMDEMKFDMSGAAAVFGTFKALAELQPKLNAVGIVPTCENMPSGTATKPGDVVTSMSGKTIEILNTDAEGRLILCDALTYAQENYEPSALIDIATLTGACVIALGSHHSGLMANSDTLAEKLLEAGQAADDRAWRLPLGDDYARQLQSNFADMANIGGREAGTITAGCFLGKFTEGTDWAHLDIAGTAYQSGAAKGSTGRPVPLLMEFLLNA